MASVHGTSAPTRFAAVEIHGNTPGQVREVTEEVFRANGYQLAEVGHSQMTFEKPGTKMNNIAYGNWISETPIWIRVQVAIVPTGEAACLVHCQAWYLRDKGGATEEQIQLSKLRRGPYQKLLDEVWGYERYPTTRTVDTHVLRLRRKFEADPDRPVWILTLHGHGYKFATL